MGDIRPHNSRWPPKIADLSSNLNDVMYGDLLYIILKILRSYDIIICILEMIFWKFDLKIQDSRQFGLKMQLVCGTDLCKCANGFQGWKTYLYHCNPIAFWGY